MGKRALWRESLPLTSERYSLLSGKLPVRTIGFPTYRAFQAGQLPMNLREHVVNLREILLRLSFYHCWRDLAVLVSRAFAKWLWMCRAGVASVS